jgi:LPXTG-motif cell wall-anchored protein
LGARRLPQTGQLWWPIPILAIVGIILIFLGFRSERKRK